MYYQKLFDYFANQHGVILLESEMQDVIHIVKHLDDEEEIEEVPTLVGTLNKPFGLNHYETAQVGHEVYLHKDRYYINLRSLKEGGADIKVPFYIETLKPFINSL